MNHIHDYEIVMREVLKNGEFRLTQECKCGKQRTQDSKTGDWVGRKLGPVIHS